jgi:hypothetical protein
VLHIQAANVLNELYCARLRKQLACKEKKKSGGKGRLTGDGLLCLLSGDEFYEKVGLLRSARKVSWRRGKSDGRDDCRVEESGNKEERGAA